ncbi:unnamed protein product [Fusarium langsethiae]|nr:unnamed protein product [Fusarium langsethiae]
MLPSTPAKKRAHGDDNEETPRAETRSTSRHPLDNPPELRSSASSVVSQSDTSSIVSRSDASMASRDSKRSKRSQSPTKLFPLYGEDGQRLIKNTISTKAPPQSLPLSLSVLIRDINNISRCCYVIPQSIKADLTQHLTNTAPLDELHDFMFFDDASTIKDTSKSLDWASPREVLRSALHIVDWSNKCTNLLSDESAWNNTVHTPLLQLFTHDMYSGENQELVEFISCTTTNVDSTYHKFPETASRVDYVLHFVPESNPALNEASDVTAPCFNWTTDKLLQQYPFAVAIETKRYAGNTAKGHQQMGVWYAAMWEFLLARAGSVATSKLEFIPGVVVQGHLWSLVITTRSQGVTTVLCSVEFGNTSSVIGVLQVLAGLRRLRKWSLDVLWPWYRENLPGLC